VFWILGVYIEVGGGVEFNWGKLFGGFDWTFALRFYGDWSISSSHPESDRDRNRPVKKSELIRKSA
jgi:hypothetical protein